QAQPVPWVGVIGPLRRFAYESVALDDIKEIRKAFDVKVNDVVLAIASGALRRWLLAQDALPDQPIIASVPMSIRSEGDVELGNKLTTLFTSLETHIEDPVERLRSIAEKMHAAKEIGNALRAQEIRRLSESVVPGLANLGWRAYQAANLEARVPNPSNLIVANVPGPPTGPRSSSATPGSPTPSSTHGPIAWPTIWRPSASVAVTTSVCSCSTARSTSKACWPRSSSRPSR